jgi:Flp pilus assembly protein TadG
MRGKDQRRGWDEGATVVESAITFSAMLTLIFGVVGFGYALWQWSTMMLAVEQAGRYVMINNTTCDTNCAVTQMQTVLTTAVSCPGAPIAGQICVSATWAPATTPPTMTLTAAYNFNLVALTPSFTMTSQTVVPLD